MARREFSYSCKAARSLSLSRLRDEGFGLAEGDPSFATLSFVPEIDAIFFRLEELAAFRIDLL